MALEQRILFDGAAAAAADQQHAGDDNSAGNKDSALATPATHTEARSDAPAQPSAARHLLVLDSRIEGREQLLVQLPADVQVLVVDSQQDGLAAICASLAQLGQVDSIQILSHGAAGQFTLGSSTLSADNIEQFATPLGQWRQALSEGADIQLYGCKVGEGSAGRTLVDELARWTGADVGASSNDSGSARLGGDWNLEVRNGNIDQAIALSATALSSFDSLLANASPTLGISSGGSDVLLGGAFSFDLTFSNPSSQVGFAPYIDLFMPATGKDGDDGVSFVSASYLGQNVQSYVLTFDANGKASHPLAKDSSGNALILDAASLGLRAGDQLVVLQLPYASVSQGQPGISVQINARLSELADTDFSNGSPDLTIRARSGFQFGNDALDNPASDPSLVEASLQSFVVHPTVLTQTQTVTTPEGETATGPNYERTLTSTVTPAPGQTLSNVVVTQPLPPNVQVNAITPGPGGSLTSITLHDGRVITDPAQIATLIAARDVFIDAYTVTYATLSAATSTVVDFYVPDVDANGQQVIDPLTGDERTITVAGATVSGNWVPLDPRDVSTPGNDIDFTATGQDTNFVAKSITLLKQVSLITDLGQAGITPGDTLHYSLNLAISDYFAFGQTLFQQGRFVVVDQVGDGLSVSGPATLTITSAGRTQTVALVTGTTLNVDGSTTLTFDIAQSLRNANGSLGALLGDLAFQDLIRGATTAVIGYNAVVAQSYTTPYPPHSEINEGDSLGNNAQVSATLIQDALNLTGYDQSDRSTTTSTIPTRTVDIELVTVNNGVPPANGELRPGDLVTFRLSYDLVTGDYEQFKLTAYLPLPLFDLGAINWSQGNGVGQWSFGAGNSNPDGVDSVTSGPGNAVIFDFGDYTTALTNGSRIEVQFTLRVGDQPFADQRSLDVLAQSSQLTTIDNRPLISSDVALIASIAEPVLAITHGVVSSSQGSVTGTSGSWKAPGTSGVPFSGQITSLSQIDGNVSGIDGGDTLRLATAIENTGGGGAFDVVTGISLPNGLGFVGGSLGAANLQVYRGDGSLLVRGVDYEVNGNQISFLDAGAVASLLPGRSGTAADTTGANIVVITYDVQVVASIEAGRTLQSTATLSNYASVNGGSDFTPTDLQDLANQQVATPEVRKTFAGGSLDNGDSSASHTSGSDLVVGESMLYDIKVTLPEGDTRNLRIDDLIPPGLRLDTSFNGGQGYQLITTVAGSAALTADFNGSLGSQAISAIGGSLGGDGVSLRLAFSNAGATADNRGDNNSFVIRVRLTVSNVDGNQSNRSLQNSAQIHFSDPDGDTANGSNALDRTVALSGGRPTVTVREPTLVVDIAADFGPGLGVDEGQRVRYLIVISNGSSASDFDAFDIRFLDNLPTQLSNLQLLSVNYSGASNNGGGDFELVGNQLRSVNGANIDIAKGGRIFITVVGDVNASAASVASFDNLASVQWSSLNGTGNIGFDPAGERTGADGMLNSGVLNDYQTAFSVRVPVNQGVEISRVGGLSDSAAPNPTNSEREQVAIGEIIRYRVVAVLAQGSTSDYSLQVTLQNGLGFLNDGNTRIAFISDQGISSSIASLINGGQLNINGAQNAQEAQPISADLLGAAPGGILNGAQISVSTDANGNTVITFHLGDVVNHDNDLDKELVSLEFNVRVLNQASNVAGLSLSAVAIDQSRGVQLSRSQAVYEDLVEPRFNSLDKRVVDFDPNPSGSSGTATLALSFTHTGGIAAYDAQLRDSFPTGSSYSLLGIELNGTLYTASNLPAGVTFGTSGGLGVDFAKLNVGDQVKVTYQVTLPNLAAIASSNATLTWTSLPESFNSWGGSSVGSDGSAEGERTGAGASPNTYILSDAAGLGLIQGTLWDDTASATTSAIPDGPGLAGQTVTLTWAGLDGNLDSSADNKVFTTTTDANGRYHFGVLPSGVFRIDVPSGTVAYPQPLGELRVRIDSDAGSALGRIDINLGEGSSANADAGFVQLNDAPVNQLPGTQNGFEDTPLAIGGIRVSDVDIGNGIMDITLSVLHGTLSLSALPAGVSVVGNGSGTLSLSGNLTALNQALANLVYLGNANFNGIDTLTVLSNDRGGFGDGDGDGLPGQNPQDARTDQDSLQIILAPVNDAPLAVDDAIDAVEAGGTNNRLPGVNPSGNLLRNDQDVDIATNADVLRVSAIGLEGQPAQNLASGSAVVISGRYGSLIVSSSGGFLYLVDNNNAEVQALRLAGQTLVERFVYTATDLAGASSSAALTVTVHGANDTPVAVNDEGIAVEAGGVANGTAGSDATGNVLSNDTDVDSQANGEVLSVTGIRSLRESAAGTITPVAAGTTSSNGTLLVGSYGTLTIGADGSYRYVVDNSNTAVQRMVPGDSLFEYFSYQVTDAGGLNDIAELRITIQGAQDNPLASDDQAVAQAGSGPNAIGESNPRGNVILFPSRPGPADQPGGNGIDLDVDRTDRPNSLLQVNGIRTGSELAGGALLAVAGGTSSNDGTVLLGSYGELRIGADGSYFYDVDSSNAAVQALLAGQTLSEVFTYQVVDSSGLTDRAQLVITIRGVNDPPVAQNHYTVAIESGGVANTSAGFNPSGNALAQDTDPDGDPIRVVSLRHDQLGTSAILGQAFRGQYGTLTLNADGSYTYLLDNDNAQVQGLRDASDNLLERFTFAVSDGTATPQEAQLVVLIFGRNDNPVATDDQAEAIEAGGSNNSLPGRDPVGNVLTNDNDVDSRLNGETKAVSSVRTGSKTATGTDGVLGTELRGTYGWLTLNADGSYSYRLDNSMAAVQALRSSSDTLEDSFSYTVIDTAGAEDRATLSITIRGANDAPLARNDLAIAVEAGGLNNSSAGVNPSGNVLDNDSDVDAYGETLQVTQLSQDGRIASLGSAFKGLYGTLVLNADGSYHYELDNSNPQVQALRTPADRLLDTFTYSIRDLAGATSSAVLSIRIHGSNDNPQANDDSAIAIEAGGTANATAGLNPQGNVLANDSDVDANDLKRVDGLRLGSEAADGSFSTINGSLSLAGLYGTLTLNADGSYQYVVNNNLAAVQALKPGESLVEVFTYRMHDRAGASDTAQLQVQVRGAWDAPVARDDGALAVAESASSAGIDPSGNLLPNDSDVDGGDRLVVTGIRAGSEAAGGSLDAVSDGTDLSNGTLINGLYGQLIVGADGSYIYRLDSSNPVIRALGPNQFITEVFTYQVSDLGGLSDQAQLTILIRGRNDAPQARDDSAVAIEAGGLNNNQPGLNPSGNLLSNDTDVDHDILSVAAVRTGGRLEGGTAGTLGSALRGLYGDLTVNADGSWSYVVDNSLAAVQALRTGSQTLREVFTYTVVDRFGGQSQAQLIVTLQGRNDTPIAQDDHGVAIEAGGVDNATPGQPASGNVLDNDSDVDGVEYGETRQVLEVRNEDGSVALAGQVLQGRYGQLLLASDGSYRYQLDDNNPQVQALRTAGETLREVFTYRMRDTAGAQSEARLHILIQGANDNPVARDDHAVASDQTAAPQATGNVLPNDSDVDAADQLQVVGIRTGSEAATGTGGSVGQPLAGRYGTLVINADGSYRYQIDLSNPEVLAAAGLGRVLQDVFTYTVGDRAGATDLAQLVIDLDIAAPFIPAPAGPHLDSAGRDRFGRLPLPTLEPAIFVTPVVEQDERDLELSSWAADGSDLSLGRTPEIRSATLKARLGLVPGQFVASSVAQSRNDSEQDLAWMLGRHGRLNLSADGLLADPSVFASSRDNLTRGDSQLAAAAENRTAPGLRAQLREAAQRLRASADLPTEHARTKD